MGIVAIPFFLVLVAVWGWSRSIRGRVAKTLQESFCWSPFEEDEEEAKNDEEQKSKRVNMKQLKGVVMYSYVVGLKTSKSSNKLFHFLASISIVSMSQSHYFLCFVFPEQRRGERNAMSVSLTLKHDSCHVKARDLWVEEESKAKNGVWGGAKQPRPPLLNTRLGVHARPPILNRRSTKSYLFLLCGCC